MEKKVLTEQALYFGDVNMPKYFEINRPELALDIFKYSFTRKFPMSKSLDKLDTYIRNYLRAKHNIAVVSKTREGFIFQPNETTKPCMDIDFESLKDSADYTMLYGVGVEDCYVTILYDNNRRKQQYWKINLTHNKYIIFPSSNMYFITNDQNKELNFVLKMTYRQ
jgi:hypothetical protein|tara:strand:+ start:2276 stop:2773 length:498 start_codon:yes stop_codon:yes gene_type:complete